MSSTIFLFMAFCCNYNKVYIIFETSLKLCLHNLLLTFSLPKNLEDISKLICLEKDLNLSLR